MNTLLLEIAACVVIACVVGYFSYQWSIDNGFYWRSIVIMSVIAAIVVLVIWALLPVIGPYFLAAWIGFFGGHCVSALEIKIGWS